MFFSFIIAIFIDYFFGELPATIHPVVWIGNIVNKYKNKFKPVNQKEDYLKSIFLLSILIILFIIPLFFIDNQIINGIILTTTFSFGYFYKEIYKLYKDFKDNNFENARTKLSFLVSRNTAGLSNEELLGASIETTIENITDSITAPLFYFIIGGVPFAMLYRILNTLDAMIGYKDKDLFYYGKIPAKIDDVLNYIPARLTVFIFYIISNIRNDNAKMGMEIYKRDKNNTDSPNAGCTMSYIAGVLKVKLTKTNHYSLGDGLEELTPNKLKSALEYLKYSTIAIYGVVIIWAII